MELAAGERSRVGVGEAGQADALEQSLHVEGRHVAFAHSPGDVFGDVLAEDQELGALSDQRGAADRAEHAAAGSGAGAGRGAREEEGEGGFARPVVSDDDGVFGALEGEGDAAQGGVVGARVGEGGVGECQGQGGRGRGLVVAVSAGCGGVQERVPPGVERDAAQDRAEEPSGGKDQEGDADESGDGDPHPPPVDEPLAELMAGLDETSSVGDVRDEGEEPVEALADAFEAEGAQVGQDPEGESRAHPPDDAEAGGDRADGRPGGAFLVEVSDDEADEGCLEGAPGGGESADGDGEQDGGGEGGDGGAGAQLEGGHGEGDGRGDLEEELEDGGDGGDETEGDGQAGERAGGRHLDGGEAAGVARV